MVPQTAIAAIAPVLRVDEDPEVLDGAAVGEDVAAIEVAAKKVAVETMLEGIALPDRPSAVRFTYA